MDYNIPWKAQLICDQFLNSPILPRCRINIQPEISATIIENVKLGMFDLSLFHDCTINIFPLLLNYWKIFCLRRHKYIPRAEISQFKVSLNPYFPDRMDSMTFCKFQILHTFFSNDVQPNDEVWWWRRKLKSRSKQIVAIRLLLTIVLANDTLTRGWTLSDVWTIMRQCHFQSRLESNSIYRHHRRKTETIFRAVSWIKRIAHFLSIDDDEKLIF